MFIITTSSVVTFSSDSVVDQFDPLQAQNGCGIVWIAAAVVITTPLLCVLLAVIFVFPLWKVEELRNSVLRGSMLAVSFENLSPLVLRSDSAVLVSGFMGRGDPQEKGESGELDNRQLLQFGQLCSGRHFAPRITLK